VENEANRDSTSTNGRGSSLLGLFVNCWVHHAVTRDFCPAFSALVGPVQNIFILTVHCFNPFVLIAQQAGQAVVQGRLSLNVFLCHQY
jgi:hypothetical protein